MKDIEYKNIKSGSDSDIEKGEPQAMCKHESPLEYYRKLMIKIRSKNETFKIPTKEDKRIYQAFAGSKIALKSNMS